MALRVTLRNATDMTPAVHAISATAAMLHIERLTGFIRVSKCLDQTTDVIRMDNVVRGPLLQFLEGLAEVFQDPPVDVLNLACGIGCGHKPRDAVDHQAEVVFARAKRLLHALAVLDVCQQHVPADGTTPRIASGKGACLEPTVHAVRAALAEFEIVGLPCLDRVSPCRDRAGQVLGMDRIAHLPVLQLLDRLTEVIEELAVEQFDSARGIQGAHKPRDAVDDEAKPLLARGVLARVVGNRLGPHQVMLYPPCYAFSKLARSARRAYSESAGPKRRSNPTRSQRPLAFRLKYMLTGTVHGFGAPCIAATSTRTKALVEATASGPGTGASVAVVSLSCVDSPVALSNENHVVR